MTVRVQGESATARGRVFTADDFRVPAGYLPLLVGQEAANDLNGGPLPDDVLPSMRFLHLCLEHMRRTSDESCGTAPTKVARGVFGMLIAAASQGDNFAEALQRFAAAAPVLRPDITITFTRSRRGLALSFDYAGERDARRDLITEIFAITAHCGFRWLTGQRLRPAFLRIAPPTAPMGPTLLRPVLGALAQRGGAGVTVGYDLADAEVPLKPVKYQHWAAHELDEFKALLDETAREHFAARSPAQADIVARVRAVIGPEAWSEPAAAKALGMSTATLRRRLSEAGSSFRTVSSDVRRAMAESLLVTGQSLDEIAERLGFSDARSFRRACQTWFGMAPAAYRKQAR